MCLPWQIFRPKPAPPISTHWSTYALYITSVLSALLSAHFFFLRRWTPFRVLGKALFTCCGCCGRRKGRRGNAKGREIAGKYSGARGTKTQRRQSREEDSDDDDDEIMRQRPVHVNLVMDPRYFPSSGAGAGPGATLPTSLPAASTPFHPSHPPGALFTAKGDPIPPSTATSPPFLSHYSSGLSLSAPPKSLLSGPSSYHLAPGDPNMRGHQPPTFPLSRTVRRHLRMTLSIDRRTLTRLLLLDSFFALGWGTLFILTLFFLHTKDASGKPYVCKPGAFGGWCNAYNTIRAAGCVLSAFSLVAFWLDVRDVRALNQVKRATGPNFDATSGLV